MTVILRWLLRIFAVAVVALAVGAALAWYLVSRSLPEYSGELALAGLEGEVTITRDANAVPHIRATTDRDAHFALGLVHAQDRLWQMELNRRAAQGTLSALFGERTVGVDRLVKTLGLHDLASRAVEQQTEETRAALEAYAAGVNAWIRHVNTRALGRGAPELFLFSGALAPWTPADSIAVLKLMSLRLTGAARNEIRRARFLLKLTPEQVSDILADDPNPAVTAPARYSELFPGARFRAAEAPDAADDPRIDPWMQAFGPAARPEMAGASNAWAVDGSRASGAAPLLASDPHLWLSAPGIWYLAGIRGAEIGAIGGTIPGMPGLPVGRNRDLAWGQTTANADDQDIFIEKVNPENADEYRTPDGWAAFEERRIRIEVAGGETRAGTVRATRHGPVLAPDQLGVGAVTPEGHVAALAWTALEAEDRTMSAVIRLMRAGGIDEAVDASEMVLAPAQNLILADRTGVAMVMAGRLPERQRGSTSRGRLPTPGWRAENDWMGLRPASENPRVIRPPEGAVANANNRITDAPYPDHISHDWEYPYRIRRLEKELTGRAYHSRDGFVALQNDAVSEMARAVLPLIARDLWWGEAPEEDDRRRLALDMLKRWNGAMDRHSPEPLIFYEWMRQLTERLAADELGPLLGEIAGPRPLFVERVFRDVDGAARWCDVDKTPQEETCGQMAALAFDDALAALVREYGSNLQGWRWGGAHVAVHRHTPMGHIALLAPIFNITNETSGGNYTLLRGQTPGAGDEPFRNVHAAGMRMVVDFADPDGSVMIASTGQSGHPLSRWYDHFADLWARGDTVPMSMSDEDAAAGAVGVMTLRPGE